jgi:mannose-6-phosphate isomerase-like protein (cupin superfamily)
MDMGVLRANSDDEYYTAEGCFILELSNSIADEQLSIARARVEPGVSTRLHRLTTAAERYVITAGQGCVQIGNLAPKDVIPGDVVLIPAGINQRIENTGETDLVFLALCTPRFLPEMYIDTDETSES